MSTTVAAPGVTTTARKGEGRKSNLPLVGPAVGVLLLWMIVPLVMTLWFSFQRYNLLDPTIGGFAGLDNYEFLVTDPDFWASLINTFVLVGSVLAITVGFGTLLAVLYDQPFLGQGVARLLAVAPFFVMPTVSALVWKNLMMHLWGVRIDRAWPGSRAGRLVRRLPDGVGHHHRVLAVATVCATDPANRRPVA